MSTTLTTIHPPKEKKHIKKNEKEPSRKEKKPSKKRQREEDDAAASASLITAVGSPKKKARKDVLLQSQSQIIDDIVPDSQPPIPPSSQSASKSATIQSLSRDNSTDSLFYTQTSSFYVPLAPISQTYPLDGLCAEHLSPLLLTYSPLLKGVVLSYSNVRLGPSPSAAPAKPQRKASSDSDSEDDEGEDEQDRVIELAKATNEYAAPFLWITADFLLLKPKRGLWVEGYVNLSNESHLGLIVYNLFGASIERAHLPSNWVFHPPAGSTATTTEGTGQDSASSSSSEGYFTDAMGTKIDGLIRFRVRDFETTSEGKDGEPGLITFEGTLLGEEEEREVEIREAESLKTRKERKERRKGTPVMSGALRVRVQEPIKSAMKSPTPLIGSSQTVSDGVPSQDHEQAKNKEKGKGKEKRKKGEKGEEARKERKKKTSKA
ncbi:hypothetical protein M501DRAFT_1004083 [Patellaria atrata CBS 101060]|uniref:DNA-directed RNA polymerase subunit n=1 Tax=Patellaria atrata CBS 101060 TaxID=1346257 RepID=A0A9P4SD63_9PEZI|nr:hypothetical protein M501DRAFT_1004083 [Patellaria atrata CBS 101060]